MAATALSPQELERYARQIGPGVLTAEGQLRLKNSTALISRVGGMGGPAALSLVLAGVGRVVFAHGGRLISPDMNRQILGCEAAIGQPRVERFAEYLQSMNRHVAVEAMDHEPDDDEALALARRANIVLSCPPTFQERLRLNRAAVLAGVPFVDAAQWGMSGTLVVVQPGQSACLRCIYPKDPEFEEFFPVVGAIAMAVGALAALEAIKILSGCGTPAFGRLRMIDGHQGRDCEVQLTRDPACGVCGRTEGNL